MSGKGQGKKKTDKRARPSMFLLCSISDELVEDGRHYEELLTLYKALEQKDAEKSVHIAGLQALLQTAKDEIKVLTDKVAALETSLQFTQQEQDDIKDRVATCEKDQIRQETELTRQSIYSRRWNLLLFRISKTEGENCHQIVKDVFKNNLQIPDQRVDNMPLCGVHRLGKKHNKRPRPIIVRFTCRADRDHVWSRRRLLAESNIRMGEDLPFNVREIRKNILVPALQKAQKTEGVKASIVVDKLVMSGRPYTFNKIPSNWRPDQPQLQQSDIHGQNAAAVDLPIAHETGYLQETPENA